MKLEQGFVKADSANLPVIDSFMLHTFYCDNPQFLTSEVRNVKAQRATRENYGDDAIGFIQLKRSGSICTVKALITPEHRVRDKGYAVTVVVDEGDEKIVSCYCHDCIASTGGCKHSIATLFWLYRRSSAPAVTSVECYWRTSTLSKVGKSLKTISLKEMFNTATLPATNTDFLQELGSIAHKSDSVLLSTFKKDDAIISCTLHNLAIKYALFCEIENKIENADDFILFCKENISDSDCNAINNQTVHQSKCSKWYEARYCRITASKLYECTRCKTYDGSLVESLFGSYKLHVTDAMERGLNLEEAVLKIVREKYKITTRKSGVVINKNFPIFGASPDAISEVYCIEIKCPYKDKTVTNYINESGEICNKPYAQMQLQMYLLKKQFGLFCVASPNFENNQSVEIIEVRLDKEYCEEMIVAAEFFWKEAIFPKLIK